jgi:hypothetical protein
MNGVADVARGWLHRVRRMEGDTIEACGGWSLELGSCQQDLARGRKEEGKERMTGRRVTPSVGRRSRDDAQLVG